MTSFRITQEPIAGWFRYQVLMLGTAVVRELFISERDSDCVRRCIYENCQEAVDGWFYLAPGEASHPWPVSVPYLDEPLPLCHWHGLLLGDERVPTPFPARP
jgi:hypothetical protein